MNQQLIRDENHRNTMNITELQQRMAIWLDGQYQAIIFEQAETVYGYVLFRREADFIYLRQFYVKPLYRRQGIGRTAIEWLCRNVWNDGRRIRLEVLVGNTEGLAFWKSVGFGEYSLTLEKEGTAEADS